MPEEKIELSEEQKKVIEDVVNGHNVLITGSAGTGKSTILKELKTILKEDLSVTASTGIAAVNVGGMTLHSWAGIGLADKPLDELVDVCNTTRILKAKWLAIDEISMIDGELFELIDNLFKRVRCSKLPFGGIQLVLFGDFLQLPPVNNVGFAFQSDSWREANIRVHVLKQVFRQQDAVFSGALNDIRVGKLTTDVRRLLTSRYQVKDDNSDIKPVMLHTHNVDVDTINNQHLAKIEGETVTYAATDTGTGAALTTLRKNCLAPEFLNLKVGAQVMLLKNLEPLAGLANGSIGVVVRFATIDRLPVVRFANGREKIIEEDSWTIKAGNTVLAKRVQIPLRLAWAITIHKSQGMTLDKVQVHLSKVFEFGQGYVALSRARTLNGLYIESSAPGCIQAHPDALEFYEEYAET